MRSAKQGNYLKREMTLSPNDEEVASSKKHTQFKTRVHKPYPISDQNGRNWYPISDQNSLKKHTLWRSTYLYSLYKGLPPPGRNMSCRLRVSTFTQARLTRIMSVVWIFFSPVHEFVFSFYFPLHDFFCTSPEKIVKGVRVGVSISFENEHC